MLNMLKKERDEKIKLMHQLIEKLTLILSVFSIIVLVIIGFSFVQFKKNQKSSKIKLDQLIEQSHLKNDSGIKVIVREMDHLSRRTFFGTQHFLQTGVKILLCSMILLVFCFKFRIELNRQRPKLNRTDEEQTSNTIHGYEPLIIGLILLTAVLVLGTVFNQNNEKVKNKHDQKEKTSIDLSKEWPNFRGYLGHGIVKIDRSFPVHWDTQKEENIKWKTELSSVCFNSPIVIGERIYLSEADEAKRVIKCFELETGNLLWGISPGHEFKSSIPEVTEDTGLAAPTMASDGELIAGVFGTGELLVVDSDGQIIWEKFLGVPENHYGHSSSLMIDRGRLWVQFDHGGDSKCFIFSIQNGELLQEIERDVDLSWASPIIVKTSSGLQMILKSSPWIIGYDVSSYQPLWTIDDLITGEIGPSPAYENDHLFFANQYSICACYDIISQKVIWEFDEDLPDVSSPVAHNGFLVMTTSYGVMVCLDSKTGKKLWKHKFNKGFYSSPIISGDKIYALDLKGTMRVVRLSENFELISSSSVNDDCVATPAFVKGKIIIRSHKYLICIEEKK